MQQRSTSNLEYSKNAFIELAIVFLRQAKDTIFKLFS